MTLIYVSFAITFNLHQTRARFRCTFFSRTPCRHDRRSHIEWQWRFQLTKSTYEYIKSVHLLPGQIRLICVYLHPCCTLSLFKVLFINNIHSPASHNDIINRLISASYFRATHTALKCQLKCAFITRICSSCNLSIEIVLNDVTSLLRPLLSLFNICIFSEMIDCLRWMIPSMVVHPEKIDFRRFV